MLQKDCGFIFGVLVQANFANPKHSRTFEKFRDHGDHLTRKLNIFRLFGINAKPCVMCNSIASRTLAFEVGQLTEIIAKSFHPRAIKTSPESGFADQSAAGKGHAFVIVGGAGNHVDVGVDVACHALLFFIW